MKNKLLILPSIFFAIILSIFFYLLITERNPSEIPSNLLNKNVPFFEAESLFKNEKKNIHAALNILFFNFINLLLPFNN